ncbi:MAG: hypothetical protein HRT63_09140 [Erythrobacter sp.]|nr:hypothetical protein [Erythrobacter sp.]
MPAYQDFEAATPKPPRKLQAFWVLIRDGLPSVGRYRRYLTAMAGPLALIWICAFAFILFSPDRYDSRMTLILPGTGVGASMNLETIGQASTNTASAFSSPSLSPTENYKRLLMSDLVLNNAAERTGDEAGAFPAPYIKLIDQTNLIEVRVSAATPDAAAGALDQLKASEHDRRVRVAETSAAANRLAQTLDITLPEARRAMQLKADPEFQELLSRYAKAAGEHSERSGTLGNAHGAVEELAAEKASLRADLARRGVELTDLNESAILAFAELSVTAARENLFSSLSQRDSDASGNGSALVELRRQIAQQSADTDEQVAQAARLADLLRDLRVAEAVFSSALAQLDTNKSDPFASYPLVQTLEAPSLPSSTAGPSALLVILAALMASIFVAIGFLLLWLRQPIIRKLSQNA